MSCRSLSYGPLGLLFVALMTPAAASNADLNPKTIAIEYPKQIKWTPTPIGALISRVYGDPSKPGFYIALYKWPPHQMSHPHSHPNDRFITVISGTWWVGTGSKFDPDKTVPLPPGTIATHFAGQVHYDGAKDEETVIEIAGQGPATHTDEEEK
jgi:hypothetical protein